MAVKICDCGAKMAFVVVRKEDNSQSRVPIDLSADIYEATDFDPVTGVPTEARRVKNTHFVNHFKTCPDAQAFTRANRGK